MTPNTADITANYDWAAEALTTAATNRKTTHAGVPFGHTGQCDACKRDINYNDRMEWSGNGEPVILCFWCSMAPPYRLHPTRDMALAMIKDILTHTTP